MNEREFGELKSDIKYILEKGNDTNSQVKEIKDQLVDFSNVMTAHGIRITALENLKPPRNLKTDIMWGTGIFVSATVLTAIIAYFVGHILA